MRLAFSNIAWPAEADAAALEHLAAAGFTGLEVAPTRIWPDLAAASAERVLAFRGMAEDRGLPVVAMQSLLFQRPDCQLFGDADAVARLQAHLLAMARLGAGLGATRLVFGSPGNRKRGELTTEQAMERAVPVFQALGRQAADLGVCFCIEANPPDYGCDFLVDAGESTAFVRAVDSPGVRLHLDAACMAMAGDDPVERVRAGADLLAHVHASAPQLGEVADAPPVQHGALATALREVDYGGFVSVEMRTQPEPVDAVRRSAAFVLRTYA